ncbi:MAG: DotA/TraY family protein [Rhodospirillales bacterium]|nr:DotA/TraY family protein [Rhodospirillales bacterium]
MNVRVGKALKYTLLPEILPRIKGFGVSGFAPIAIFIAYVYQAARLLPAGHPYLNPANFGKFGIFHVIREARSHLVFKRQNIDQIIIFLTIPIGLVILLMQFVLLVLSLSMQTAQAATLVYLAQFFKTPNPENDIAFMLLDGVFGIDSRPGAGGSLFESKVATLGAWGVWPNTFHQGLHALFEFYSYGLFFVALLIMLYLVVTVVAETAASGVPFGQRFNKAWAPIRLIVAVSLLFPITGGINGAQLITLYTAKFGSSLATNGWHKFLDTLTTGGVTPLGVEPKDLVATPNDPQLSGLMEIVWLARTCTYMQEYVHGRTVKPHLVHKTKPPLDFLTTGFNAALTYTGNQDIVIRFGENDPDYDQYDSNVRPLCGEIVVHPWDLDTPGAFYLQESYYDLIKDFWNNFFFDVYTQAISERVTPTVIRDNWTGTAVPTAAEMNLMIQEYYELNMAQGRAGGALLISEIIKEAVTRQEAAPSWATSFRDRGWAGAGIWYNRVAELNGSLIGSAKAIPDVGLYPEAMEIVKEQRRKASRAVGGNDTFKPVMPDGKMVEFPEPGDEYIALALYYAQSLWFEKHGQSTGNIFIDSTRLMFDIDSISGLFGLDGLFNMVKNPDTHPLAQLVGLGSGLVQNAVVKFGAALGTGVASKILGIAKWNNAAAVAQTASSVMSGVAMLGLSMGFILYYIVPFLPFVYFFFAVGNWVKAIFEAMVGLPLWALAHIRIDGEGLPGPAAMNGYFLIFEILIRPILIIFGFIAAISIFAAQVYVLHEIWQLVVSNLTGYDPSATGLAAPDGTGAIQYMRGAIDSLLYTVIYAIIVYMLGMSAFKLVDLVPNHILRWLGASVSTFAEQTEDPAQKLVQNVYVGSNLAGGQLGGMFGGLMGRNS